MNGFRCNANGCTWNPSSTVTTSRLSSLWRANGLTLLIWFGGKHWLKLPTPLWSSPCAAAENCWNSSGSLTGCVYCLSSIIINLWSLSLQQSLNFLLSPVIPEFSFWTPGIYGKKEVDKLNMSMHIQQQSGQCWLISKLTQQVAWFLFLGGVPVAWSCAKRFGRLFGDKEIGIQSLLLPLQWRVASDFVTGKESFGCSTSLTQVFWGYWFAWFQAWFGDYCHELCGGREGTKQNQVTHHKSTSRYMQRKI